MPLETEPASPAERIEQRKVEAWKDVIQRDSVPASNQSPDQVSIRASPYSTTKTYEVRNTQYEIRNKE